MTNLIGKSVKRVEDKRFLTGKGSYVDDMVLPNMTWAVSGSGSKQHHSPKPGGLPS